MKFLQGKLDNPSTPLNIRLFIAKLIINAEEVLLQRVLFASLWIYWYVEYVVFLFNICMSRYFVHMRSIGWAHWCSWWFPVAMEERAFTLW